MQVLGGLARRPAWEKFKVTTNPTDEALAVLQLQVQPGEKWKLPPPVASLPVTPGCSTGRPSPPPDSCPSSHRGPRCSVIIRSGCSSPARCSSCHSPRLASPRHLFPSPPFRRRRSLVSSRSSTFTLSHSQRHVTLFLSFVSVAPFSLDPFWTCDLWLTTERRLPPSWTV